MEYKLEKETALVEAILFLESEPLTVKVLSNKAQLSEEVVEKCIETVNKYSASQTQSSIRLGQWMNWDDSYYTNSDNNITTIWHFLKKCHEKNWVGLSYRPMPWCTHCGTSLSEHEMSDADAYKDVTHLAIFFKCPILNTNNKPTLLTAVQKRAFTFPLFCTAVNYKQ